MSENKDQPDIFSIVECSFNISVSADFKTATHCQRITVKKEMEGTQCWSIASKYKRPNFQLISVIDEDGTHLQSDPLERPDQLAEYTISITKNLNIDDPYTFTITFSQPLDGDSLFRMPLVNRTNYVLIPKAFSSLCPHLEIFVHFESKRIKVTNAYPKDCVKNNNGHEIELVRDNVKPHEYINIFCVAEAGIMSQHIAKHLNNALWLIGGIVSSIIVTLLTGG